MYANKLAVAIKHRGKVLQEFGEVVYLPFGSEYGLLLKNLNSVRASVKVSIDGQDATEGVNLVVPPNSSIELERFIKNGNLNAGNRFKFIERTAAVAQHRGTRLDDGLIRISFAFELPQPQYIHSLGPNWLVGSGGLNSTAVHPGYLRSTVGTPASYSLSGANGTCASDLSSTASASTAKSAPGITAPGSVSQQQFQSVSGFQVEATPTIMIIQLAGQSSATGTVQNVQNTVYTRSKVSCTTCGQSSKPTAAFCSQCGTSLNVIG